MSNGIVWVGTFLVLYLDCKIEGLVEPDKKEFLMSEEHGDIHEVTL